MKRALATTLTTVFVLAGSIDPALADGKDRKDKETKGAEKSELEVGDKAPSFEARDDEGKVWKSKDQVGKKILVVYFYPADMTGGCTKQACAYRDDMEELRARGVEVVGVSGDSVKNHRLFKQAEKLNFTLLADEDGSVARKFGVPLKDGGSIVRQIDGEDRTLERGVTAERWTFVIDREGRIAHKDTSVNASRDSKEVLAVVERLQGVDVGDKAPSFEAKDEEGKLWRSKDHAGKKVLVVYFYPADMTPGCTKQACAYRDDMEELRAKGVEVVGVSGDSVRNHRLFRKKYDLNFTLLADEDGSIARKFGVPVGKGGSIVREVDDRKETLERGVTAERWTFVIDRDGKVVHKEKVGNAAGDSRKILRVVEKLGKKEESSASS